MHTGLNISWWIFLSAVVMACYCPCDNKFPGDKSGDSQSREIFANRMNFIILKQ